jgi:hypothetical protein
MNQSWIVGQVKLFAALVKECRLKQAQTEGRLQANLQETYSCKKSVISQNPIQI